MGSIADASKKTIGELLGSNAQRRLVVPDYQRSYSWDKNEVDTFWLDLSSFEQRHPGTDVTREDYFIGSIVAVEDDDKLILVDGQQRLATATILLAVLRDIARQYTEVLPDRIQRDFIRTEGVLGSGPRYSLTLNAYDRDFFRNRIQDYPRPDPDGQLPPKYSSHNRILNARDRLCSLISSRIDDIDSVDDKLAVLTRVRDVLCHRVVLVLVSAREEDAANDIFETLNDRGLSLSTLDLLRNFLLSRANEQDREEIVRWWGDVFSVSAKLAQVQTFLRHHWITRHGDVKSRGLYKEMKTVLLNEFQRGASDPKRFSLELSSSANVYSDLIGRRTDSEALNDDLDAVAELNATAVWPVALAAVEKHDAASARGVVRAALDLYVRWNVIMRLESTELEEFLYKRAHELWEGASLEAAVDSIVSAAPPVEDFVEAFAKASLSRRNQQRHVLERLEMVLRKDAGADELEPRKAHTVHVEHVYPQKPAKSATWKDHDNWIDRIGNLTLLHQRLNASVKNGPFDKKKTKYVHSHLMLTRQLMDFDSWSPKHVEARQRMLAELAPRAWPITY